MLIRKLVVVGLVGFCSLVTNIAIAQEAVAPDASTAALGGINFADPSAAFPNRFEVSVGEGAEARFAALSPADPGYRSDDRSRRYQLEFIASGAGVDVAFAQRGGLGFNDQGDVERETRASELRLGRGLREARQEAPSSEPSWYLFAASEDEALVWRPGVRNEFGGSGSSFALQERVEIGDLQAGITYERHGIQASLAYVEREFSVYSGAQSYTQEEEFVGLTLTMRR
jgi:hypothetical protein